MTGVDTALARSEVLEPNPHIEGPGPNNLFSEFIWGLILHLML